MPLELFRISSTSQSNSQSREQSPTRDLSNSYLVPSAHTHNNNNMSSTSNIKYEPVSKDDEASHRKSEETYEDLEFDPDTELMGHGRNQSYNKSNKSRTVSRILAVANLLLFFILLITWFNVLSTTNQFCPGGPEPPYCEYSSLLQIAFCKKEKFSDS